MATYFNHVKSINTMENLFSVQWTRKGFPLHLNGVLEKV